MAIRSMTCPATIWLLFANASCHCSSRRFDAGVIDRFGFIHRRTRGDPLVLPSNLFDNGAGPAVLPHDCRSCFATESSSSFSSPAIRIPSASMFRHQMSVKTTGDEMFDHKLCAPEVEPMSTSDGFAAPDILVKLRRLVKPRLSVRRHVTGVIKGDDPRQCCAACTADVCCVIA